MYSLSTALLNRSSEPGKYLEPYDLLLRFGILAPAVMAAIILVMGFITPEYDPIKDTISLMGASMQPYSVILNTAYIVYGTLLLSLVFYYRGLFSVNSIGRWMLALLLVHAAGSICLALFPDQPDNFVNSRANNTIHNVISGFVYVSLLQGILSFSFLQLKNRAPRLIWLTGILVFGINLIMPFINYIDPLKNVAGLMQRLLTFVSYYWIATVCYSIRRKYSTR